MDKLEDTSYELLLKMEAEGHYITHVVYGGQNIGPASGFTIICLTGIPGHMTTPLQTAILLLTHMTIMSQSHDYHITIT